MSRDTSTASLERCRSCDAPNAPDRDTCWRCLRDLAAEIAEPAPSRSRAPITVVRPGPEIVLSPWPTPDRRRPGRRRTLALVSTAVILVLGILGVALANLAMIGGADRDGAGQLTGGLPAAAVEPSPEPPVSASPVAPAEPSARPAEDGGGSQAEAVLGPAATGTSAVSPPDDQGADRRRQRAGNAFACGDSVEPIRDLRGRTWRVTKVSFRAMPGYERVILHLDRVGTARPGRDTVAIAGRVPQSEIARLPRDVRPERARRGLLRIDLPGVPDGPELRAFRPLGLGSIGELSLLPGRAGRTALLAVDADACFRVRVPAWGSGGTADTQRAEVVIDIRS